MGKRNSKAGYKKSKSKKSKEKKNESNSSKRQENSQKSAEESFFETILESNAEQNENSDINNGENISETSYTNTDENTSETSDTDTNEANNCYEEMKAKQQEFLNNIKNLSEAIGYITLTRDNINSLRIEELSQLYFAREVRPLVDALNLIAWASFNTTNVSASIQNNTFGDNKESKHSLKLTYKMNDEIDDILGALSRRIKLYIRQLDYMDRNCPPFDFKEDS